MAFRRLTGVDSALQSAQRRKAEEDEATEKKMNAGESAMELPPPPEHAAQNPKKKKKKNPPPPPPPPLEGEILEPVRVERETETRHSTREVSVPMAFPVETGATVFKLARYGLKPHIICKHIDNPLTGKPITLEILESYFSKELREGQRFGALETAKAIHDQVTGEGGAKRSPQLAAFRAKQDEMIGFTETTEIIHTTKESEELRQRLETLSDDDIKNLRAILAKRIDSGRTAAKTPRVSRRAGDDEDSGEGGE